MDDTDLEAYREWCNRQSTEWLLTRPCTRCGQPITGDVVLRINTNPPTWWHPDCYGVNQ